MGSRSRQEARAAKAASERLDKIHKMNRRLDRRFSAAWPLRAPLEFVGVFLGFPALCPTPSSLFWIVSVAVSLSTETFLHDIPVGSLVPFV